MSNHEMGAQKTTHLTTNTTIAFEPESDHRIRVLHLPLSMTHGLRNRTCDRK